MADILNEKTEEEQWKTAMAVQKVKLGLDRRKIYGIADMNEVPGVWEALYKETYGKLLSETKLGIRAVACAHLGGEMYEEALANGQTLARSYAVADGLEDYEYQGALDQLEDALSKISVINHFIGSIRNKPKGKKKNRFLFF